MSPRRFAMKLKRLREARGMTQDLLAKRVRVSRGYLSRLEMGRHDPPLSLLRRLAKELRVKVAQLVE
jgi:putative transcriptional regulator